MSKYRFKLLRGTHREGTVGGLKRRKTAHKAGDIVESDRPLDEMFGTDKFERLKKAKPKPRKKTTSKKKS